MSKILFCFRLSVQQPDRINLCIGQDMKILRASHELCISQDMEFQDTNSTTKARKLHDAVLGFRTRPLASGAESADASRRRL